LEKEIEQYNEEIIKKVGIKKQDTGLSLPSQWNLQEDKKIVRGRTTAGLQGD